MWNNLPVALASLSIVDEKPSEIMFCIKIIDLVSKLELLKKANNAIIKIKISEIVIKKLSLFLNIKIIIEEKAKHVITVKDCARIKIEAKDKIIKNLSLYKRPRKKYKSIIKPK